MVDFDLVKRVAKTLGMSEQEVMNAQFVELIERLVDENVKLVKSYENMFDSYSGAVSKFYVERDKWKNEKEELVKIAEDYGSYVAENPECNHKQINDYCIEAHEIAKSKGWYDKPVELNTSILLIHAELSEAVEALRKDDKEHFEEELADVAIRLFDLCGYHEINLGQVIDKKMEKNRSRTYRHGGKKF